VLALAHYITDFREVRCTALVGGRARRTSIGLVAVSVNAHLSLFGSDRQRAILAIGKTEHGGRMQRRVQADAVRIKLPAT
jgi:hypothetical protein